jgi:hypothetical protein
MSDIISFKGELEFAGASEDDKLGRVVKFRIVKRPEDIGLAHPFATGRRRKAKVPGTRFFGSFASVQTGEVVYGGEVMLLGWADGPGGSMVSFILNDDDLSHPFITVSYKRASRGSAGTRLMAALAEIGDDEIVVNQVKKEAVENPPKKHHQTLSNYAALLSKDERFHDWLREHVRSCDWTQEEADSWIKGVCRIESKRELDSPGEACDRFHRLVRRPYSDWLDEQGLATTGGW